MSIISRIWLSVTLLFAAVALLAAFAISRYQHYRTNKIEFIIWDNQHENVADLTKTQFTEYLHACGAHIDSSKPDWIVRYDGFFEHRTWAFPYAAPKTTSSQ